MKVGFKSMNRDQRRSKNLGQGGPGGDDSGRGRAGTLTHSLAHSLTHCGGGGSNTIHSHCGGDSGASNSLFGMSCQCNHLSASSLSLIPLPHTLSLPGHMFSV